MKIIDCVGAYLSEDGSVVRPQVRPVQAKLVGSGVNCDLLSCHGGYCRRYLEATNQQATPALCEQIKARRIRRS